VKTLIKILFFLLLLANSLTLVRKFAGIEAYTLDLVLIPFTLICLFWNSINLSRVRPKFCGFDFLFLTLFGLMILSLTVSINKTQGITHTLDWVRLLIIYFLARTLMGSVITEQTLRIQFGLLTIFLMSLGLLQIIMGKPIGLLANYFGRDLNQVGWSIVSDYGARFRVSGPTPNSNVFAMWIIIYGGLSLSFAMAHKRFLLFICSIVLMWIVLIGTLSRGGFIGFSVFLLLLMWFNRNKILSSQFGLPILIFTSGLLAIMLGVLFLGSDLWFAKGIYFLFERQSQSRDFSEGGLRRELIEAGLQLLANPKILLVGCGADSMLDAMVKYAGKLATSSKIMNLISSGIETRAEVHNVWIRTAVETGFLSSSILFSLFFLFIRKTTQWRRKIDKNNLPWTSYLLSLSGWYILISSQIYLAAAKLPVLLPIVLLMAFVVSHMTKHRESPPCQ